MLDQLSNTKIKKKKALKMGDKLIQVEGEKESDKWKEPLMHAYSLIKQKDYTRN